MLRFVMPLLAVFMLASPAYAKDAELNSEELLDALATAMVMQELEDGQIRLRQDQNFFDQIKDFIAETKDYILQTYDYNGNGFIDPGPELDAVLEFAQVIITALIDTNYNGTIEPEELQAFIAELLQNIKNQLTVLVCTQIDKEVEKVGKWIVFLPVLQLMHQQCQASLN